MNDYVTREEYMKLVKEVEALRAQLAFALNFIQASSNLATPEQQKMAQDAYLSQLQTEAMHKNNERSFH